MFVQLVSQNNLLLDFIINNIQGKNRESLVKVWCCNRLVVLNHFQKLKHTVRTSIQETQYSDSFKYLGGSLLS